MHVCFIAIGSPLGQAPFLVTACTCAIVGLILGAIRAWSYYKGPISLQQRLDLLKLQLDELKREQAELLAKKRELELT